MASLRPLLLLLLLLPLLLLLLGVAPSQGSIRMVDKPRPIGNVVSLSLANFTNPGGVLSETGIKCDEQPGCDTFFIVSLGTDIRRQDVLKSTTEVWRNQDSVPNVFFNQNVSFNGSLPKRLHLYVEAMDKDISGNQRIGEFDQEIRLNGTETQPKEFQLFSTKENKAVSLTVQLRVTCAKYFYGPTCSEFCKTTSADVRCRPDGTQACADGSTNCLQLQGPRQVRVEKSVSEAASTAEDSRPTLLVIVLPGVCLGLLVATLLVLLVRLIRGRSQNVIVIEQDASPESGCPTDFANASVNQRFRNPVYSAIRARASPAAAPLSADAPAASAASTERPETATTTDGTGDSVTVDNEIDGDELLLVSQEDEYETDTEGEYEQLVDAPLDSANCYDEEGRPALPPIPSETL